MSAKNTLIKSAIIVLSLGLCAMGFYLMQKELSKEEASTSDDTPSPSEKPECPNEKDHIQLVDSEKCKWECSSFYTAPTEQRCTACKGVVMPQKCPQCPPLCAPSMWLMEKRK